MDITIGKRHSMFVAKACLEILKLLFSKAYQPRSKRTYSQYKYAIQLTILKHLYRNNFLRFH